MMPFYLNISDSFNYEHSSDILSKSNFFEIRKNDWDILSNIVQQVPFPFRYALSGTFLRASPVRQNGPLDEPINLFMVNLHHPYIRVPAGIL